MHVKRCLALFLGVVFSVTPVAVMAAVKVADGFDQKFTYTDPDAKTVSVAGEFSNWTELPMTRDDAGHWSRTVHLKAGYYGYKFVVNGDWILDPGNPARKMVSDIEDSAVSIGGVTATTVEPSSSSKVPVTFSFTDAKATSVHLAGEFNNWVDNVDGKVTGHTDWLLKGDGSGNWTLTIPLAPGKYRFKYVIDGGTRWEKDRRLPPTPDDNSLVEVKAGGNESAGMAAGGNGSTFLYTDTKASTVQVAGDFNAWLDNVDGKVTGHGEWLLQNDGAGNWKLTAPIPPGRHKFKYVIDGGARWETDSRRPVATDGNSILDVTGSTTASPNGPTAENAPAAQSGSGVTFAYADPTAKSVFVAGEFNEWSATANPMQKDPSGAWTATIPLKPGKYQYKFVVDGNWKQDPANPDGTDDTYGGKNSVKSVGP